MPLIRIQELFGRLLIHACVDHSLGTCVCGGAAGVGAAVVSSYPEV